MTEAEEIAALYWSWSVNEAGRPRFDHAVVEIAQTYRLKNGRSVTDFVSEYTGGAVVMRGLQCNCGKPMTCRNREEFRRGHFECSGCSRHWWGRWKEGELVNWSVSDTAARYASFAAEHPADEDDDFEQISEDELLAQIEALRPMPTDDDVDQIVARILEEHPIPYGRGSYVSALAMAVWLGVTLKERVDAQHLASKPRTGAATARNGTGHI